MQDFICVRSAYYKAGQKSTAIIGHGLRKGNHAKNRNISFPEDTKHNIVSCDVLAAYKLAECDHREAIGKSPQKNRNALFEHVLVLSEDQFKSAKPSRKQLEKLLNDYQQKITEEFGFKSLGFAMHFDEGHHRNGKKRNIHAHVYFYNFDFARKKAPLRELQKKGIDPVTGELRRLNPNFQKMQTIASNVFSAIGFRRGITKESTGAEHKSKNELIDEELNKSKSRNLISDLTLGAGNKLLKQYFNQLAAWTKYAIEKNEKRIKSTENRMEKTAIKIKEQYTINDFIEYDEDFSKIEEEIAQNIHNSERMLDRKLSEKSKLRLI
jgi:hypothetical protein